MSPPDIERKAAWARLTILETAARAGKGHVAPALSVADILATLFYGGLLKVDARQPQSPDRDRLFFSKGHACLALYVMLADLGFFSLKDLEQFERDGHMLAGHPDQTIPGVEHPSGSLGHGLGVAAGSALAGKHDGKSWHVWTILGDGECQEGSVWEAAMFASQHRLTNLTAIIDRNRIGATEFTEQSVALEPLHDRWKAMGWDVARIDGHSVGDLFKTLEGARRQKGERPLCVIADTVKGKGVSFMQNSKDWHHQMPKGAQLEQALGELRAAVQEPVGARRAA